MNFSMLSGEHWYGGVVTDGDKQPLDHTSCCKFDMTVNQTVNQAMPLFLSDMGRYLWCDTGFRIQFTSGNIEVDDHVLLSQGHSTLRGAYLAAMTSHFPFHPITLNPVLFSRPQYNSWIELTYDQRQQRILDYADAIISHGFEPGVLMIDDGWSPYYGDWRFAADKFPDPAEMLRQLNKMGFSVMMWVCPFVTPDTVTYREARDNGLLVLGSDGQPHISKWWNGYSAVLDFSNPQAIAWLDNQLQGLIALGVAGFKFDAGDSLFYPADGVISPNEHSRLWAAFGERYPLNEYRASYKAGGYSLMQRLCDKLHTWEDNGLATLIPHTLLQGILGYPFSCPDMIGGGDYLQFKEAADSGLDPELFCRHSEAACMLPAMQFSAAPWRVLDEQAYHLVKQSVAVRERHIDHILAEVESSRTSGEPIVRYMEYVFPHQGMAGVVDQFMLGSSLLVAPIVQKGTTSRNVVLPAGHWQMGNRTLKSRGEVFCLTPTSGEPIILERCK